MAALVGTLTAVGNPFDFSLFFARQPEPDLEFTEEELDQTAATRPITPMKMPKKSGGGRPLLWIFLLALIAGAGYIAMEPEQLTEWLAPFLGESSPPQSSPPMTARPSPTPQASPMEPVPPSAGELATAPATAPSPSPAAPAAPPIATTPAPAASRPSLQAPVPPAAPSTTARAAASPLFAEGQKVTAIGNPTAPGEMVLLTLDAAGGRPGPTVRPGSTMSILDGDLQPSGWVYSVRTDDGVKGWISEKRLRLKF